MKTRAELLAAAEALEWAARDDVEKCAMMDRARELRAKAEAMPAQEPAGWYCPNCECGVDPIHATYSECHDECGTPLTAPPSTTPPDQSARIA